VRVIFAPGPEAEEAAGLLDLPWSRPLEQWEDNRLVTLRDAGVHRHVVRFISEANQVWAVKELPERLARREYRLLKKLADLGIPSVIAQGVIVDRGPDIDAGLVTRYLEYSTTYRALFSDPRGIHPSDRLLDALVELLVRLHLAGFYWGDCSLSNTLFRLDAGALGAYLVDAETSEFHSSLSDGQRNADVIYACERVAGELLDLEAGGLLSSQLDPIEVAQDLEVRYRRLWDELNAEWLIPTGQERQLVAARLAELNKLGFDVDEVELTYVDEDHTRLRVSTQVSEPGHHRRKLFQRTGLTAQENQARRLLNDLASYRAWLEKQAGAPVPEVLAANRWLNEVYDPVIANIPPQLREKLDPVEVFHEVLEHRWFLSEHASADVGTSAAAKSYFAEVLPNVPDSLTSGTGYKPEPEDPPQPADESEPKSGPGQEAGPSMEAAVVPESLP
jgi:hypothetical protein